METFFFIITFCIIAFTIMNLLFLLGILSIPKAPDCECDKAEPEPVKQPMLSSLLFALNSYGIKHDAKSIAQAVIDENPTQTDLEPLIGEAMKKIREKYR